MNCTIFFVLIISICKSTSASGATPTYPNELDPSTTMNSEVDYEKEVSELKDEVRNLSEQVSELHSIYQSFKDELECITAQNSCQDYYDSGIYASGFYYVDPDGKDGPLAAFRVFCNMTLIDGFVITEFGHNSEAEMVVDGCENPGCYKRNIVYGNTMAQMRTIIVGSKSCRQYIKYKCRNSMMFEYVQEAWWLAYDGSKQSYWGGADKDSKKCACGKAENCSGTSTTCNCDLNDDVWRFDDGYITDIKAIPVTQLAFGDTESSSEKGYHTLGKLQCWGKGESRTCADLKKAGKSSGNHYINPDPLNGDAFQVYCNMEKYPGTGVTIISHDKTSQTNLNGNNGDQTVTVNYNVNMTRIESLINLSNNCVQHISWQCYYTGFLGRGSYWKSRDNKIKRYWGGARPDHNYYCACGETRTCKGGYSYKCNCDYTNKEWLQDEGFLNDKNSLPVTEMYFDFYSHSSSYSGYYILGNLECF